MYNKLYNILAIAYIIQSDPIAFVQSLERGDAEALVRPCAPSASWPSCCSSSLSWA